MPHDHKAKPICLLRRIDLLGLLSMFNNKSISLNLFAIP